MSIMLSIEFLLIYIIALVRDLNGREEKPKCCSGFNTKCWRHYLKAVKLINHSGMRYRGVWVPQSKALSDSLLTAEEYRSVTFKLEW